ncbi:glycine-rich protein DOT1-like [Panicum virgatum]|uniref:Uncharacterized protein n=1 Tax=Panicum virgatum TaxID=38727 RepID=A0A8T0R731_PANVG|nr:glycine-rich protein DOT1-like [Panicum virgatum]KAG2580938.1 hypothetical protein PVAP13_6KG006976 [Panicum virgatum]
MSRAADTRVQETPRARDLAVAAELVQEEHAVDDQRLVRVQLQLRGWVGGELRNRRLREPAKARRRSPVRRSTSRSGPAAVDPDLGRTEIGVRVDGDGLQERTADAVREGDGGGGSVETGGGAGGGRWRWIWGDGRRGRGADAGRAAREGGGGAGGGRMRDGRRGRGAAAREGGGCGTGAAGGGRTGQ